MVTKQTLKNSGSNNFSASARASSDLGGVIMLLLCVIGLAGAVTGYSVAEHLTFGLLATAGVVIGGFFAIILLFVVLQLAAIFLFEHVAIAIGINVMKAVSVVSNTVFSDRSRELLGKVAVIVAIPFIFILFINLVLMGMPSLFLAVYTGEVVFGVMAGFGFSSVVSGTVGVVSGVGVLMVFLGPISAAGV